MFLKKPRMVILPAEAKEIKEAEVKYPEAKPKISVLVFPQHPRWKEAVLNDSYFGPIMRAKSGESKVAATNH